jgi:hypothetical protein
MPESKKVALISFNDLATVDIPLQAANSSTKKTFKKLIDTLHSDAGTDIIEGLATTSRIIKKSSGRNGVTILISDGGQSEDVGFKVNSVKSVVEPFVVNKIPIYTIMLENKKSPEDVSEGISLLKRISSMSGGKHSTVSNFKDMEIATRLSMFLIADNLLTKRFNNANAPTIKRILRILFITIIGLLIGYMLYNVFSYIDIRNYFLVGGSINGLLSGIILELGLQNNFPPVVCRILICILLSMISYWVLIFKKITVEYNK